MSFLNNSEQVAQYNENIAKACGVIIDEHIKRLMIPVKELQKLLNQLPSDGVFENKNLVYLGEDGRHYGGNLLDSFYGLLRIYIKDSEFAPEVSYSCVDMVESKLRSMSKWNEYENYKDVFSEMSIFSELSKFKILAPSNDCALHIYPDKVVASFSMSVLGVKYEFERTF